MRSKGSLQQIETKALSRTSGGREFGKKGDRNLLSAHVSTVSYSEAW